MARLFEYQGKQLLKKAKVPVPQGEVAATAQEASQDSGEDRKTGCRQSPDLGRRAEERQGASDSPNMRSMPKSSRTRSWDLRSRS